MRYLRIDEVVQEYGIERADLDLLVREEIVQVKRTLDGDAVISVAEAEKACLGTLLLRDLDVNLPGVEVILHMREDMIAMRRQFGRILETLVDELRETLRPPGPRSPRDSG